MIDFGVTKFYIQAIYGSLRAQMYRIDIFQEGRPRIVVYKIGGSFISQMKSGSSFEISLD